MDANVLIAGIIILTVALGIAAGILAVIDARADRAHAQWMRRNEFRRRRTRVEVKGIRYGYRGAGLDGEAARTGATRKHTRP